MNPILVASAMALLLILVGLAAVFTRVFLIQFRRRALEPFHRQPRPDVTVGALGDGHITLIAKERASRPDWAEGASWGLAWDEGYGALGEVLELDVERRTVVRRFAAVEGHAVSGMSARIDSFAFYADPQRAHGLEYEEVLFDSPLGTFGAWRVPAAGNTWAVLIHGHRSDRHEFLRILPCLHSASVNALVIQYRNDSGCPSDPSGQYRYGLSEWEDVEAAVGVALDGGADRVLLIGSSMGGAITLQFMRRSSQAEHIVGLVLDSPMLDLESCVNHMLTDERAPGWLARAFSFVVRRRFGLDVGALNALATSAELATPMLVIQGTADREVPVWLSEELARARPDLVTLERFEGARHVRAWNTDSLRYESAVKKFLANVAPSQ